MTWSTGGGPSRSSGRTRHRSCRSSIGTCSQIAGRPIAYAPMASKRSWKSIRPTPPGPGGSAESRPPGRRRDGRKEGIPSRIEGTWYASVSRAVLEVHSAGACWRPARRSDSARVFDLAERVIPPEHHGRRMEREESRARAVAAGRPVARRRHRQRPGRLLSHSDHPGEAVLAELLEAGELRRVSVEGWREPAYLHPDVRLPARIDAASLLSPFDPVVWFRPRASRLFDFEYRFEIFVPAPRRRWGRTSCLSCSAIASWPGSTSRRIGPGDRLLVLAAFLETHARSGTRRRGTRRRAPDLGPLARPGFGRRTVRAYTPPEAALTCPAISACQPIAARQFFCIF